MNKKYCFLLLYFIPCSLSAQQSWDLKQCIAYGLTNNRNTVVYANEKLAADALAKETLSDYLPKLSLNGSLDNNLKIQQSVIPAGVFGPEARKIAFTQKYNTNLKAQLDQTIFDQSLLTGIRAKKYNAMQADLNIQKSQETIIYNISNAYFQIYVYREQLRLLQGNLGTYQKQIDISKLQVDKGVLLQKDLDKVTVDYNNAVAQIRIATSNLTLSENQLKYEMGFPFSDTVPIDSVSQKEIAEGEIKGAINKSFVANLRSDYQLSEVNIRLLEIDQKKIKAGMLPTLAAYASYGAVGFGNTLSPALKDLNPFSAVGLKLNFPIFDFFKRNAQYNQAKYKSLNAVENLKLDEGKYRLEYENARTEIIKSQNNLENDKRNIELAQSVFRTTDLQYQKGTTDLLEWITAQNSIIEAQNNYLNSLYSFYQAKMDLEKAGGSLKTFYTSL
jgi:outer membrane protein